MSEERKTTGNRTVAVSPGHFGQGGAHRFRSGEKAKDAAGTYRKLLAFYVKEARSLFLVFLLMLLDSALVISGPYFVGKAINAMEGRVQLSAVSHFVLILLTIYIADTFLTISQGMMMNRVSQRIVQDLRRALFDKFQSLPLSYHDRHTHGELMSRMTNDVDNISQTIAQSTVQLVSALVTLVGSVVLMLVLNVYLTITTMIAVPLVYVLTRFIAGRSRRFFREQQASLGELNGMTEESIAGQKMIKAFNMEEKISDDFIRKNEKLRETSVRAQIWSGTLMPFMNIITNLIYALVASVGGILAIRAVIPIGTIASFITYSRHFTFPLNNIAGMFNNLQSALAGAERVFEVMAEPDEPGDRQGAIEMGTPKGDVCFSGVSFSYLPEKKVLERVSFSVKPGQRIALVGPTGAGKTTIIQLLARFYDVTEGAIFLDGVDIRDYRRDSLRRAFSVVLQDTCLFTGTIADNIRYARPEAGDEEVEEAAKAANAHAFIMRLRNGYQTQVSGESDSLSQGQRQLLAISRAVLSGAPILILDEATSNVDTHTELSIQEAIRKLSHGCTSFVIAHRLSTIRDADMIFVVMDGKIVERGTHGELLACRGEYAKMHNSQYNNC